uniref:Mitochondrial carrier protein n=1 Tax=Plectus sambesii TaxID=2011161 RepID=A0A914VW77_9BILA
MASVYEIESRDEPYLGLDEKEAKVVHEQTKMIAVRSAVSAVCHPLMQVKVLMQLGHEPYPLTRGKVWYFFGREAYTLPNGFQYARNIFNERGFTGLYTGVGAALCGNLAGAIGSIATTVYIDRHHKNLGGTQEHTNKEERQLTDSESFRRFVRFAIRESVAKTVGTIVARPFQVIMIRKIAQVIGNEVKYTSVFSSFLLIEKEEGFYGFFAGLVPQLVGELVTIWALHGAAFLLERALVTIEGEVEEGTEDTEEAGKSAVSLARKSMKIMLPFLVNNFVYPYSVVSTIMAVSGSGLAVSMLPYAPTFGTWQDCWSYLKADKHMKRGAKIFFRTHDGPITVGRDNKIYSAAKKYYP